MSGWLDKRGLAEHLSCSIRSIEAAAAQGMPHAVIFGRVKFRVDEVEAWLEQTGRLKRAGDRADTVYGNENGGPATLTTPPGR